MDLLKHSEGEESYNHGNQRYSVAHISKHIEGFHHNTKFGWICTEQDGKVCEVRALADCHDGIGEYGVPRASCI